MSKVSSGVLATDLATIGNAETTLYIDGTTTVANPGLTTVPSNVHIVIRDAGLLKLALGCTLKIVGPFDAPRKKVFAYIEPTPTNIAYAAQVATSPHQDTDVTAAASSTAVGDVALFPAAMVPGDAFVVGSTVSFGGLLFDRAGGVAGAGGNVAWEYLSNVVVFHTATGINAGTDVITTSAAHGLVNGDVVDYAAAGGLDAVGLAQGARYFVHVVNATQITLHLSNGANPVNLSVGAGETHALYRWIGLSVRRDDTYCFTEALGDGQVVAWNIPSGWTIRTYAGVARYYVRARVTTTYTTNPTVSRVRLGAYETTGIQFAAPTALYPEWWGAQGDGMHDDSTAIQRAFDCPSALSQQNEIVFTSGKTYLIKRCIQVGNVARSGAHCAYVVRGWGASVLVDAQTLCSQPTFKLGRYVAPKDPNNVRVWKLQWLGLSVQHDATRFTQKPAPGTTGIGIAQCHFGRFQGFNVGGFETGIRYLEDGGNSNIFEQIQVTACRVGVRLGGTPDGNLWRWIGGKVQQCCATGIHASGASVSIVDTDISLCAYRAPDSPDTPAGTCVEDGTDTPLAAIRLEGISEGYFKFYTEGVGFASFGNSNRVVEMQDCNCAVLEACRINGVSSVKLFGDLHYQSNAAYGIHLSNCHDIRLAASLFTRHQRADVHVAADCTGIVIEADNHLHEKSRTQYQDSKIKVADLTPRRIDNKIRTRDLPRQSYTGAMQPAPVNVIPSPSDFNHSSWTFSGPPAAVNGSTLAPDGISLAQVIDLPITPSTTPAGLSILSLAAPLDVGIDLGQQHFVILRYWWQPITVPMGFQSQYNLQLLRSEIIRGSGDVHRRDCAGVFTGGGDWQFEEQVYDVSDVAANPGGASLLQTVRFFASDHGGDGIRVALWGVQLFATDDLRKHIPYL